MPRLLFSKTGNAIWISHLDLMRVFQRAFKRAGLPLTHTQGFNPRPSVSIALPLSVGVQSHCELLDFEIAGDTVPVDEICRRLNDALIDGVRVLQVYEAGRKLRDLALMACSVTLEYDLPLDAGAAEQIEQLFASGQLIVPKKTKNGMQDQDIIPMIRKLSVKQLSQNQLELNALICCQNPTLNPMQMVAAIELHLPQCKPDHSVCCRLELYDNNEEIFR